MENMAVHNTGMNDYKELFDSSLLNLGEDFTSSMTNLLGTLQLFKCNMDTISPEQRKQLNSISEGAKHLLEITDTIEDIIKCKYGLLIVDGQDFDFFTFLHKIVSGSSPTAIKRHLMLDIDIDEDMGTVRGDELKLQKLFKNLIHNLIVFTESDRQVGVEAHTRDGHIETRIWNDGTPLAEQMRDRLFLPADHLEKAPTKHTLPVEELIHNKGAGFLVAKEIIELHNGTISVTTSFKKKNCIVITLPVNGEEKN